MLRKGIVEGIEKKAGFYAPHIQTNIPSYAAIPDELLNEIEIGDRVLNKVEVRIMYTCIQPYSLFTVTGFFYDSDEGKIKYKLCSEKYKDKYEDISNTYLFEEDIMTEKEWKEIVSKHEKIVAAANTLEVYSARLSGHGDLQIMEIGDVIEALDVAVWTMRLAERIPVNTLFTKGDK